MYFGAAYYPEHWPEERWETDAKMMREAGFNTVRMAEFAWTRMEPTEGEFDFAWLDRSIALLAEHGIKTVLGTPTAAPPKWLVDKHPDIFPLDYKGHAKGYGHRRYYCYNNKNYLHYVRVLVEKMAERYGCDENVIGWQIDNELGCVDTVRCYCPNCRNEFQKWLKSRYTDINDLNEKWGTVFSNQIYGSFDEVILPTYGPIQLHNPGLSLDFRRFSSDSAAAFLSYQIDILKKKTTGQAISTNLMNGFTQIDYNEMARKLDVTSMDIYPNHFLPHRPDKCAMQFDHIRGNGDQKNFWVVELQSGPPGGDIMRKTPKPGELRKWTYQAIAHGADMILYFRWRTCAFGLEEFWHGILDHHGGYNRRYEEVKKTGHEIAALQGLIENSSSGAEIAIVYSYDIEWVFEIQPHISGYKYGNHVQDYYTWFHKRNIPVDIISMEDDFSAYKCVLLPNLIMCGEHVADKIVRYVKAGGYVVMDYRAGAKYWDNRMVPLPLPGAFRELLGITVQEYGILADSEIAGLRWLQTNGAYSGRDWYDVLCPEGAETLAEYATDYFAGNAAVTVNKHGDGSAYYIGTRADEALLDAIFSDICDQRAISPVMKNAAAGVEAIRRITQTKEYIFIINHNAERTVVTLDAPYKDILNGGALNGEVEMEPCGVLVLATQNM